MAGHPRSARGPTALLASRQRHPLLLSQTGATILLGRDFVIRAANPAYAASSERGLPRRPGTLIERRWMIVNTPVVDGDDVIGASVRATTSPRSRTTCCRWSPATARRSRAAT